MTMDQQPPASSPVPPSTAPPPTTQPGVTVPIAPVVRPRKRSSRILDIALLGAALLAIGGVAFGVGRATAPPVSAANDTGTFRGANGFRPDGSFDPNAAPGRGGAFALGGGLSIDGTVTAMSPDSLTLKLASGQEVTFALDSSTAYHQATAASASDVAVGANVSIKVKGGGGGRTFGGPSASQAPGASPAPAASGAPRFQASDVTVTH
jgi:hypothetical protein